MRCLTTGRFATVVAISLFLPEARGEDLNDAWTQAIQVNAVVDARSLDRFAAGLNLGRAGLGDCPR